MEGVSMFNKTMTGWKQVSEAEQFQLELVKQYHRAAHTKEQIYEAQERKEQAELILERLNAFIDELYRRSNHSVVSTFVNRARGPLPDLYHWVMGFIDPAHNDLFTLKQLAFGRLVCAMPSLEHEQRAGTSWAKVAEAEIARLTARLTAENAVITALKEVVDGGKAKPTAKKRATTKGKKAK